MKIGIDLDETTLNLICPLIEYYKERTGIHLERKDFKNFNFSEVLNIPKEEEWNYLDEFYNSHYFDKILPLENSIRILKDLAKKGELFFITARPENWRGKTEDWLLRFADFPHKLILSSNVHKEGIAKKKFEICNEEKIKVIVEDDPCYALDCAKAGIKTILIDKPWNQETQHENIIRANNWEEIGNILKNDL